MVQTCESISIKSKAQIPPRRIKRFLDYLFIECGLAGATIEAYRRDLIAFWSHIEQREVSIANVAYQDVQSFLIALAERGLAESSIARNVASLKMFLRFLLTEGVIKTDIATLLETPRKWRNLPKTLRSDQVENLINAPDPADDFYYRDRAILELLYATGMRVSEIASLPIDSLNMNVGFLRCFGKGSKERIIPIGGKAIAAVRNYLEYLRPTMVRDPGVDALFLSRTGKPLDRTNIWRLIRKYAHQAGLGDVSPHTLRHCFATHLLGGGADLRIVQELLGHADVTTTQIYTHVDDARLQKIHEQFHPRQ